MVDNVVKYAKFIDYVEDTLETAEGNNDSVTVEILPIQKPSASSHTADTTSSTAVAANNGPLQNIRLRCFMQDAYEEDAYEEVDRIPVEWTWKQVLS